MTKERFEKLTPNNSLDESNYDEAFDYIFQNGNEDIRNVGIMGVYGSGKSSIVRSYENKRRLHFLYVSVADFSKYSEEINSFDKKNNNSQNNDAITNTTTKSTKYETDDEKLRTSITGENEKRTSVEKKSKRSTNEIESEIINVLLHKISVDKISQTRFPIKKKIKEGELFRKTVYLLYSLLYVLLIIKPAFNPFTFLTCPWLLKTMRILFFVIFVFSLGFWVYKMMRYVYAYNPIQKVSIKGNEIVMGDQETSYFDKYLDELIYLYAESDIDVFVFEDIDRFNNIEIFERLRYINELLNESERYKQEEKTVRFLYLIKDDLLFDERTKFFDFIVPIVPFVSAENSYEKVKTRIDSLGIILDDFMLRGIFAYISDYRLLTNIINEYLIYEKCIVMPSRDDNKLFALVVYKNVFPADFSKLKDNEGCLCQLLSYKKNDYAGREKSLKLKMQECEGEWKENIKKITNNDNDFDLVHFLLSNGYIDESYPEYISSYDGIKMSENDHIFYMNLFSPEGLPWEYPLDNPELIFKRLKIYDFEQPRILNFDVVKYAMLNEKAECLNPLFAQLKNNHKVGFLVDYLNWTIERTTIEEKCTIVKHVDFYWSNILLEENKEINIYELVCYLLRFAKYKYYKNINNADLLQNYLLSNIGILPRLVLESEKEVENFKDGLTCMNICFPSVNLALIDENVGKVIIDIKSYELNSDNLEMFMSYYSDISDDKPITRFKALPQCVKDTFLEKADITYNNLFEEGDMFYDDEKEVIAFLNNPDISDEICEKYIVKMGNAICDANMIEYLSVLKQLTIHNRLAPTLHNLEVIYKTLVTGENQNPLSNYLEFINCLATGEYEKYTDENKELYDALSKVNDVKPDVYRVIVRMRAENVKPVNVSGLTREQYRVLLEEHLLDISLEIFKHIYNNYVEDRRILIETDFTVFEQYLKGKNNSIQPNNLVDVLDYDISDEEKNRVLAIVSEEIPVRAKYSDTIKKTLLKRVTRFENIEELVDSYSESTDNEKEALLECIARIYSKTNDEIILPYTIVFDLVSKKIMNLDTDLMVKCARNYKKSEVKKLLKKGQIEDYLRCLEQQKITEEMSEDSITQAFRNRRWIK